MRIAARLWIVRAVFILPVLLVAGQFLVIRAGFGEPYPALMMPGFSGTRTAPDGSVHTETVEVTVRFADGAAAPITLRALLAPLPSSHYWTVAANLFRHPADSQGPAPARSGLKNWILQRVMPIRDRLAEQRRLGRPVEPATAAWLRHRLVTMYPGRQVAHVAFEWWSEAYRPAVGGLDRVGRTIVDRYTVDLIGPTDARP